MHDAVFSSPRLRRRKCVEVESLGEEADVRSRRKRQTWLPSISYAPTYTPTREEFEDPVAFIRRIEPEASKFGICKIRAPSEFRKSVDAFPTALKDFTFTAREQKLKEHIWDNFGRTKIIYEHAELFDLERFQKVTQESAEKLLRNSDRLPPAHVESEFWRIRRSQEATGIYILYGNDVEGSACDRSDPGNIGSTAWNLQDLGKAPWSLLRHAPMDYPGVTTPMLYIGSLFATFFWHVEDHWMHSINYSHYGSIKTWYGVPYDQADAFERAVLETVYRRAMKQKAAEMNDDRTIQKLGLKQLLAKTTLFLPKLLLQAGIPVYKVDQEPGDFVLTFPRGYHSGFSHGFNIGEAVNFALPEWLPAGQASLECYCRLSIPHILPHQLLLVKEAAALFDRLQKTKRPPDSIEITTIQQFCSFADEHARLRYRLSFEKELEEVIIADALRTPICFMCCRHICGAFVFYAETEAPRCMQCSIRASHVVHPDWKLAVPEVVGMIHYLEHHFWVHYDIKAPDHPLSMQIPRRRRSLTQQPPIECKSGAIVNGLEIFIPRCPSVLETESSTNVTTSCGTFRRTIVRRGKEFFLLAQELLVAIGAPIKRSLLVDETIKKMIGNGDEVISPIKRLCALPSGTMLCTLLDHTQTNRLKAAVVDDCILQDITAFVGELWDSLGDSMKMDIE